MNTVDAIIFFWDSEINFNHSTTQDQLGFSKGNQGVYKDVLLVNDDNFEGKLAKLDPNDKVIFVCHVSNTENFEIYFSFINSKVKGKYKNLKVNYVSKGNSGEVMRKLHNEHETTEKIISYKSLKDGIKLDEIVSQTKAEIENNFSIREVEGLEVIQTKYPQIDYAVITALYQDEFTELKNIFDFPEAEQIKTLTKTYHIGYLLPARNVKIVVGVQNDTGMVDASIIATQMLEFFSPKYLLMSGVCGGSSDYSFGDIIVAKNVYTFQKGKLSDIKQKVRRGKSVKLELFDKWQKRIDYSHLYDKDGNQISIAIERFQIEHDTMLKLNNLIEDNLKHKLEEIKNKINIQIKKDKDFMDKQINIEIAPIACSTMVINKAGFFDDTIKSINRKTAAIEMESYGVAKACEIANDGNTKWIIFKSVMDNTVNKTDSVGGINYKKFAAYTSAQFMKYLFEEGII